MYSKRLSVKVGDGSNRLHAMDFVPENKLIRIQSVESPLRFAKINQLDKNNV